MKTEITRAGLYDLVWKEPEVGKHFRVSDSTVEDICRASGIPFPDRRHWEGQRSGRKASIVPTLPPRPYGGPEILVLGPEEPWTPPTREEDIPLPPPITFAETLEQTKDRALMEIGKISTPRSIRDPHPVLLRVLSAQGRRRKGNEAPVQKSAPDALEKRRRVFINALLHVLDGFGARYVPSADLAEIQVTIGRVHLACQFKEVFPGPPARRRLGLSVVGLPKEFAPPHEWEDDDSGPLERRIADIAAGLAVCADALVRQREQAHFQWAVTRRQG